VGRLVVVRFIARSIRCASLPCRRPFIGAGVAHGAASDDTRNGVDSPSEIILDVESDSREQWSNLAHRNRRLCSPVDETRLVALLGQLPLPSAPYVVDLGCGKGEALRLAVEMFGGTGTGIDLSAGMLAEVDEGGASIELIQADAAAWRPRRSPDLAICMGSTHIFGGTAGASSALAGLVGPGGVVLLGDGYWRSVPAAQHLQEFGMEANELTDLRSMVESVEQQGLVPVAVQPSSESEWDDYEWSLIRSVELWAVENPDDPDVEAFTSQSRMMRQTFLEWRRAAMGFAIVAAVRRDAPTVTVPFG
jgi:SAM-dependent methyltransferase